LRTKDRRTANRRLKNFKRDLIAGKVKPISPGLKQTLFPFITEFLEHISVTTEPTTYELYEEALSKAKSAWGDIILSHITHRHISRLLKDMLKSGLAPATVNKNYRHLKRALRTAMKWKYIANPIDFPKPVKEQKVTRYMTESQLRRVMKEIFDEEFADLCLFAGYTGLRNSEIIRLQWEDVDNPSGFLRITAKQKNKEDSWIPINRNARAILERCRSRSVEKPFRFKTRQTVTKKFKAAARKAGLGKFRFHDLRHTYGSHLAMKGEREATIQQLMRHKSMASTFTYTRLLPEHLIEASEKVNYGPMPLPKKKK
jgi:integrase